MKLLLRCALFAAGLVACCLAATILCVTKACGAATIPTLTVASALLSPGLVLMSFIYQRLAVVLVDSLFAYVASPIPGILIDVLIYTAVFFVLARLGQAVVARRKIVNDRVTRPGMTTSNTIP